MDVILITEDHYSWSQTLDVILITEDHYSWSQTLDVILITEDHYSWSQTLDVILITEDHYSWSQTLDVILITEDHYSWSQRFDVILSITIVGLKDWILKLRIAIYLSSLKLLPNIFSVYNVRTFMTVDSLVRYLLWYYYCIFYMNEDCPI